jgi:hypothetical protein
MTARRVARLGGWFVDHAIPDLYKAFAGIEALLGVLPMAELPQVEAARAAAFLITAHDGGRLHRQDLSKRALAFDPKPVTGCWRAIWCRRLCAIAPSASGTGSASRRWRCCNAMTC